jgi:hypothetical protein
MQSANAILLSVASLALLSFSYYFINGTIFREKDLLILKCVILILWRIQRDAIINVPRCSCKAPAIFDRLR